MFCVIAAMLALRFPSSMMVERLRSVFIGSVIVGDGDVGGASSEKFRTRQRIQDAKSEKKPWPGWVTTHLCLHCVTARLPGYDRCTDQLAKLRNSTRSTIRKDNDVIGYFVTELVGLAQTSHSARTFLHTVVSRLQAVACCI